MSGLSIRASAGALCTLAMVLGACERTVPTEISRQLPRADPARGVLAMERVGCHACHAIPGVRGARGTVGPDLGAFGGRALIGGVAANTPENLTLFLKNAPALIPDGGMPAMPLSDREAEDAAAYLYTLR